MEKEMDIRVEILMKHNEFADYVNGIDYEALRKSFTRQEIEALTKMLREINTQSVTLELAKLTEEMKREEYPQLNSVHHFPIINEMSSLSQIEKEKLDEYLVMLNKGNIIYSLHLKFAPGLNNGRVENELVEKELAERVYVAKCPYSCQGNVSIFLNQVEKDAFTAEVEQYQENGDTTAGEDAIERLQSGYCHDCEESLELDDLPTITFQHNLRFIGDRDRSLDNV